MDIMQKWHNAQQEERKHHKGTLEDGVEHYHHSYKQYFEYLQTSFDQKDKTIIEIGCADVPALYFCKDYKTGHIIEPMPSDILIKLTRDKPIFMYAAPAEHMEFPKVDEVWLLNVLQHVIDPAVIIEKAKQAAKVVRFFEPINDGIDICHLHSFTLDYFKKHFGAAAKHYEDHTGRVVGFHEHECCYGVWRKE